MVGGDKAGGGVPQELLEDFLSLLQTHLVLPLYPL